jgi:chemotaxis protein MotB
MQSVSDKAPIIIKKKVIKHGGHHGGAWKVAYADFVTAMMALFIVLWLTQSSEQVKKSVGGYFRDPSGRGDKTGTGVSGSADGIVLSKQDMANLKHKIQAALKQMPEFQEKLQKQVQVTVSGEGLRIELMENAAGVFFQSGNANATKNAEDLLATLAGELGKLPNHLLIEGHTDAKPFASGGDYSNWELSADRANSVRRFIQRVGIRSDQISQVRGYADQRLRNPAAPLDPSNRRISIVVQHLDAAPTQGGELAGSAEPAPAAKPAAH